MYKIYERKLGESPQYSDYNCGSSLTVDHFKALAFSFRMNYAGPATETGGEDVSRCYILNEEVLPYFPEDVPARKRKTYWKWCDSNSTVDVLVSTLDDMLILLFEVHGLSDPTDPAQYPTAFLRASLDCIADFVVRCSSGSLKYHRDSVHDKVLDLFFSSVADGFEGSARPVSIDDYRTLAKKCGYVYLGVPDAAGEEIHSHCIPSTIFTETAVFSLPSGNSEQIVTGYFRLAMSLQRKLPTLHDIREKVEEFYRGDLQSESLEHYVVKCFEGASSTFTKHLLDAVHARRDFQEWYAAALRQRLSDTVPTGEDDHPPEELPAQKKGGAKEDFRQQAAKIRTEAYQIEVDNMSNWHAEVEVGRIRRKTMSLAEQCLSGPTFRGYEVAIHRGLLHMVIDYQDLLAHVHEYIDIYIDIYIYIIVYFSLFP